MHFFHSSSVAIIQAATEMSSSLLSPFVTAVTFSFTPLQQNAKDAAMSISFHLWIDTAVRASLGMLGAPDGQSEGRQAAFH